MNRHWNQDRTYQETRTIVGGILQSITYKEFVPTLLGGKFNRLVRPYSGYRPNVDPSVSNEFAASAYRLHGLILVSFTQKSTPKSALFRSSTRWWTASSARSATFASLMAPARCDACSAPAQTCSSGA